MTLLALENVTVKYHRRTVIDGLNWQADAGKIYSIIGPNGCGKSTLLRTIAGHLKPERGTVRLDGRPIGSYSRRRLAQHLAMLQQSQERLPEITVRTLVGYGRFPHQPLWRGKRKEDEDIVEWAMAQTGVGHLADRRLSALSGGERQRVWFAMALAQKTRLLLLDEPTTYLDMSRQWEIMELIAELNRRHGITIVMVLHDINHAAACSDEIMVMRAGAVYAGGAPERVITAQTLGEVFGVDARVDRDAETGRLNCVIRGLRETADGPDRVFNLRERTG
jgi:iron complex transport system ATP-binding protein